MPVQSMPSPATKLATPIDDVSGAATVASSYTDCPAAKAIKDEIQRLTNESGKIADERLRRPYTYKIETLKKQLADIQSGKAAEAKAAEVKKLIGTLQLYVRNYGQYGTLGDTTGQFDLKNIIAMQVGSLRKLEAELYDLGGNTSSIPNYIETMEAIDKIQGKGKRPR